MVKVARPGLTVRSRNGFYGVPDKEAHPGDGVLANVFASPFGAGGVGLRLTTLFVNSVETGSAVQAMLHIDGRDLEFHDDGDGWHKAVVDVALVSFGEDGSRSGTSNRTFTIRSRGKSFENAQRWGYLYTVVHPIKFPGAYQLRAAVRDTSSNKIGSASEFIEVPDLAKGRLALSGLAIQSASYGEEQPEEGPGETQDPTAGPAIRIFHPGEALVYGLVVYNAKFDPATRKPDVEIRTRVFHEGKLVWSGEPFSLAESAPKDPRRLKVAQKLSFGKTTPAGEYLMEVTAIDKLGHKNELPASQWTDFELRSNP